MKTAKYHLIALVVIIIWGTTFVATKMLLNTGLSAGEIFFYRFLLAYFGIWFFGPRKLFSDNLKDEFLLFLSGIFGGSLYYLAGNTALQITQASNVALLACTSPLLTILFSRLFLKKKEENPHLLKGSILAIIGVILVIFNGHFILQINPLGDMLSLLASLSWAVYSVMLKYLGGSYSMLFITRKIFFYGLLSLLPLIIYDGGFFNLRLLNGGTVIGSLLYLGIAASLLCYFLWNTVIKRLGAVRANNYVYFSPVVTMTASAVLLGESITLTAMAGAIFILAGLILAER